MSVIVSGLPLNPFSIIPSQSILFHQRYLGHHHQKKRGCARGAIINIKTNVAGGACLLTKDDGVALLCDGVSLGTRKQEDETRDIIIIIRKLRVILFVEFLPGPLWRVWVWRKSSSGIMKNEIFNNCTMWCWIKFFLLSLYRAAPQISS